MRKTLTALAVTATAFTLPMLAGGTAYAAEITPVVPQLPAVGETLTVDTSTLTDIVNRAIGGGCTTTYVANVKAVPTGGIVIIAGLKVTVDGGAVLTYSLTQAGNTLGFINCVV